MKLFFISDIHGNQFALKSVLEYAKSIKSDMIFCAGDITGYFTGVNEVIQLLKQYNVKSIIGNHDAFLLGLLPISQNKSYYSSFIRTEQIISPESRKWLKSLKRHLDIRVKNFNATVYHGGPNDLFNEYVYPDKLNYRDWSSNHSDCFVFGHTHLQFGVNVLNKIFINPGAVGLPRNGDFRAHGISYDIDTNTLIDHRVVYDLIGMLNYCVCDEFVNRIFFHNIFFGRSSNRELKENEYPFLSEELVDFLNSEDINVINTKFGAILYNNNNTSSNNLLYLASYEDDTIELTSSNLYFTWKENYFPEISSDKFSQQNFVENSSGNYYLKVYENRTLFNSTSWGDVKNAFELIKKYDLRNVKI